MRVLLQPSEGALATLRAAADASASAAAPPPAPTPGATAAEAAVPAGWSPIGAATLSVSLAGLVGVNASSTRLDPLAPAARVVGASVELSSRGEAAAASVGLASRLGQSAAEASSQLGIALDAIPRVSSDSTLVYLYPGPSAPPLLLCEGPALCSSGRSASRLGALILAAALGVCLLCVCLACVRIRAAASKPLAAETDDDASTLLGDVHLDRLTAPPTATQAWGSWRSAPERVTLTADDPFAIPRRLSADSPAKQPASPDAMVLGSRIIHKPSRPAPVRTAAGGDPAALQPARNRPSKTPPPRSAPVLADMPAAMQLVTSRAMRAACGSRVVQVAPKPSDHSTSGEEQVPQSLDGAPPVFPS